jgi:two-component sensor histidine kinase
VVAFVWTVLFYASLTGGGVRAPAFTSLLVVDFIAALVFGLRGGLLVTCVGILLGGGLVIGEMTGSLPGSYSIHSAVYIWVANSLLQVLSVILVLTATHRMKSSMTALEEDLTKRRSAERALQESEARLRTSLTEKTVLLKEVHHRVKNNMQVINSLIALQGEQIHDPVMIDIFRVTRNRIRSMALIHEALYREGDLSQISFEPYVRGLVRELVRAYSIRSVDVSVEADTFSLSIDQAIPAGLILNELVSNALKHGVGDREDGHLWIDLRREGEEISVAVRDDGPGLPAGLAYATGLSLGMQLIQMLTDQLGGTLRLLPGPGAEFALRFPHRSGR